jgi:hypothetical protein
LNCEIQHSEPYVTKRNELTNYDKLNITECKRLFEKSLDFTLSNNFQIETLSINVKVSYTQIYLEMYYEKARNIIVMVDIHKNS